MEQDKVSKVENMKILVAGSDYLKELKSDINRMALSTLYISGRDQDDAMHERRTHLSRGMVNIIIDLVDEEIRRVDNDISEMIK